MIEQQLIFTISPLIGIIELGNFADIHGFIDKIIKFCIIGRRLKA